MCNVSKTLLGIELLQATHPCCDPSHGLSMMPTLSPWLPPLCSCLLQALWRHSSLQTCSWWQRTGKMWRMRGVLQALGTRLMVQVIKSHGDVEQSTLGVGRRCLWQRTLAALEMMNSSSHQHLASVTSGNSGQDVMAWANCCAFDLINIREYKS